MPWRDLVLERRPWDGDGDGEFDHTNCLNIRGKTCTNSGKNQM